MHGLITILLLLWLVPSAQKVVFGYQAQDPYSSVRQGERIYGQQGRRVPPAADGIDQESGGERAEKALGELREGMEGAEAIELPPHGRTRRESLLGLDVPYKAPPPEQQQDQYDGKIDGNVTGQETERQPIMK